MTMRNILININEKRWRNMIIQLGIWLSWHQAKTTLSSEHSFDYLPWRFYYGSVEASLYTNTYNKELALLCTKSKWMHLLYILPIKCIQISSVYMLELMECNSHLPPNLRLQFNFDYGGCIMPICIGLRCDTKLNIMF
jgi:hypothetical protein